MKKLISKFKNWLIKKLGGHTNEETAALLRQSRLIRNYNFQPIILRAEKRCSGWMLESLSDEESQAVFLTGMMTQLSKALLEQNLVQINCADDIPSGIRTYRAELAVISPEDRRNAE